MPFRKHRKYDLSFEGLPFLFSPLVFETLGAINLEGAKVLSQLFRFSAKRLGREFSSHCGRGWARFSCNLQRSVSQAILNRVDGRIPPRSAPTEVPEILDITSSLTNTPNLPNSAPVILTEITKSITSSTTTPPPSTTPPTSNPTTSSTPIKSSTSPVTLTKTTKSISPSTPTSSDKNFNKLKNRKKFGKAGQRRNTNRLGINTFLNTSPSLSSELSSPHYTDKIT